MEKHESLELETGEHPRAGGGTQQAQTVPAQEGRHRALKTVMFLVVLILIVQVEYTDL